MAKSQKIEFLHTDLKQIIPDISLFLDFLRGEKNFPIGVSEYVDVQRLLVLLAERDNSPSNIPELLQLLSPVLCKDIVSQENLNAHFVEWSSKFSSNLTEPGPEKPPVTKKKSNAIFIIIAISLLSTFAFFLSYNPESPVIEVASRVIEVASRVIDFIVRDTDEKNTSGEIIIITQPSQESVLAIFMIAAFLSQLFIYLIWRHLLNPIKNITLKRKIRSKNDNYNLEKRASINTDREILRENKIGKFAPKLNRKILTASEDFNLEETIIETARHAGIYKQVVKTNFAVPEYLILIDKAARDDFQAKIAEKLISRFSEFHVRFELLYFDGDIRSSFHPEKGKTFSLRELSDSFDHSVLLIFSAGEGLIDPWTRDISPWAQNWLDGWMNKALFSPDALPGNSNNKIDCFVEAGLPVFPLSGEGIEELVNSDFLFNRSTPLSEKRSSLPYIFSSFPTRWISSTIPDDLELNEIISTLQGYLGANGFLWLRGCAVFPELKWELTLHLGRQLKDNSGESVLNLHLLSRLVQLPWFRFGKMPDWLRRELVYSMPANEEKLVRGLIRDLFPDSKSKDSSFNFNYIKNTIKNLWLHLQYFFKKSADKSESADYIFEDFLFNRLSVKIKKLKRKLSLNLIGIARIAAILFAVLCVGAAINEIYQNDMHPAYKLMISAWAFVSIWIAFVFFINRHIQPLALFALFMVELWERFSYYGMRAILVLYMTSELINGGFAYDDAKAYGIYGAYGALVYLTPIIGGYFADKMMGFRKAIVWGALLMAAAQFVLFLDDHVTFFIGLALLVVGNGFFKPNISSMLGGFFYQGDPRRDGGFTIFYMGINMGAFLAPLTCGTIGELEGWRWGFLTASIGMLLGWAIFRWAKKGGWYEENGLEAEGAENVSLWGISGKALPYVATAVLIVVAWVLLKNDDVVDIMLAIVGGGIILYLLYAATKYDDVQKHRIWVIVILLLFTTVFWTFFELAGSALNLFTARNVDKSFLNSELTTTFFQSINPLFILIFAPVYSWMWIKLAKAKMEPAAPYKFAIGLLLLGLGFLVLNLGKGASVAGLIPALFLIGLYLLHTLGELALSPIGLSLVTKLAPVNILALLMGTWFLSSSIAHQAGKHIARFTAVQETNILTSDSFQGCMENADLKEGVKQEFFLRWLSSDTKTLDGALVDPEFIGYLNTQAGSVKYFAGRIQIQELAEKAVKIKNPEAEEDALEGSYLTFLTSDPQYADPAKVLVLPKAEARAMMDQTDSGMLISCLRQNSLSLALKVFRVLGLFAFGCGLVLFLLSPLISKLMHGVK